MRATKALSARTLRPLLYSACLLLAANSGHGQTLTLFGTNQLTLDPGSIINLSYTQGPTALDVNIQLSGTFGGGFTPAAFDWSSVSEFGLLMSVPAADPQATFNIVFYNSNVFAANPTNYTIAKFNGSTTGVSSNVSILSLTKDNGFVPMEGGSGGLNNFTDVAGIQFTWGSDPVSGGSTEATLGGIAIVPEPSTWALFLFGGVLCSVYVWKRRCAQSRL